MRVEERVTDICNLADWDEEARTAGGKLLVLEVGNNIQESCFLLACLDCH
jgi:hypothetical protein